MRSTGQIYALFGTSSPEKLALLLETIVFLRQTVSLETLVDIAERIVDYFDWFGERNAIDFIDRYCPNIHLFRPDGVYRCQYKETTTFH